MIDRAMIKRLLAQIGTPDAAVNEKGMGLARAIFAAGTAEEREIDTANKAADREEAKKYVAQALADGAPNAALTRRQ